MKKALLFIGISLTILSGFAQNDTVSDECLVTVSKMPVFPGGNTALKQFIIDSVKYKNIQKAINRGVEGKVFVNFVIEKDGSVSNVEIARGVHPDLDAEAIRLIKSLPKFSPAEQDGRLVRFRYAIPITFQGERSSKIKD